MLGRIKTCPRRHAYPGTGLVTSSAPTIPRIASHCHRVVLVLGSLSIALLFLPLMFRPCGTYPHSSIIIHPMTLTLPHRAHSYVCARGCTPTIALSRAKVRHGGEKFPSSTQQCALYGRQADTDLQCLHTS